MPLPGIVMPLILKPHRDVIAVERPQVLDQAILMLPAPFAGEECYDRGAAFERLGAVAPAAVLGIGQRPALGIARIPGVFGHAGFLGGGLFRKRRKRGTRHGDPRLLIAPGVYRQLSASRGPFPYRPIARSNRPSSRAATPSESAAPVRLK